MPILRKIWENGSMQSATAAVAVAAESRLKIYLVPELLIFQLLRLPATWQKSKKIVPVAGNVQKAVNLVPLVWIVIKTLLL